MTTLIIGKKHNQVIGWEAIQPKRPNRPLYVRQAAEALQDLNDQYLMLTDVEPLPYGALEELGELIDMAEIEYNKAIEAWRSGSYDDSAPLALVNIPGASDD